MATGRIRRTARRGVTAAVLGWLGVATVSVLMAPDAGAAPSRAVTVEITNVTPPLASVESGGTVTFVNKIPPENKGSISVPLVGGFSATVFTDVSVTFFGQQQNLALDQSAQWAFTAPATTGTITYTYRIVPQAGLAAAVANQIVNTVAGSLPPLPAPAPYVVQTVVPAVPNLGGVNLPQLPTVKVPAPTGPITPPTETGTPLPTPPGDPAPVGQPLPDTPGDQYAYSTGAGAPRMSPSDVVDAPACDPARYFVPVPSLGGADRAGPHSGGGAGGLPGNYDGASVPVFVQLAGLDGAPLEEDAVSGGRGPSAVDGAGR